MNPSLLRELGAKPRLSEFHRERNQRFLLKMGDLEKTVEGDDLIQRLLKLSADDAKMSQAKKVVSLVDQYRGFSPSDRRSFEKALSEAIASIDDTQLNFELGTSPWRYNEEWLAEYGEKLEEFLKSYPKGDLVQAWRGLEPFSRVQAGVLFPYYHGAQMTPILSSIVRPDQRGSTRNEALAEAVANSVTNICNKRGIYDQKPLSFYATAKKVFLQNIRAMARFIREEVF